MQRDYDPQVGRYVVRGERSDRIKKGGKAGRREHVNTRLRQREPSAVLCEQITSWFTTSPMATLLCGSQSKDCWHVLVFAAYQTLIPANIPTAPQLREVLRYGARRPENN